MFRSKLEEKVSDLLCSLGIDYEYEATKVDYQITHYYVPDFILPNGIALECKGYWDSIDRRKVKNVIDQNPQLDLRMVFQSPYNKITKRSKTTYAKWCDRHNIKWCAFHTIPIEWLV
tara:strand:+ start:1274 stop:1624 length:351 start_codon:yes stop_codon:yes gene_type:complete